MKKNFVESSRHSRMNRVHRARLTRYLCDLKCGNEVKLTLIHKSDKTEIEATIQMAEIMAYYRDDRSFPPGTPHYE